MSRLTELLKSAKLIDKALGEELEKEFKVLSSRRSFGLNFERHKPENVELPGCKIKKGDKVRILPSRGSLEKGDQRLWLVKQLKKNNNKSEALVSVIDTNVQEEREVLVEDLINVKEFQDYIYPGLTSTKKISKVDKKYFNTVINGENYHVLKALTFTHRNKIDAIYIDPPYNTGAKDWKYNNDYVDTEDSYRHSKWLAFMERRLLVAKELLNPLSSVLIVTIDEKEYLRLGMLLEQLFEDAKIQMVSSVINPRGIVRDNEFSRSNEFIFFAWFGNAKISAVAGKEVVGKPIAWETMRRRSLAGKRGRKGPGACGPNQFYPIFVNEQTGYIVGRGQPLSVNDKISDYIAPKGMVAVFPARADGTEMNWSLSDKGFDERFIKGYVRASKATPNYKQKYVIQYILGGVIKDIDNKKIDIKEKKPDGSVEGYYIDEKSKMPHSQWNVDSHYAQQYGTGLLSKIMPNKRFPYAKSLYAVEDTLRYFILENKNAIVLDFFAGSGTTAHAVMRLNKQDGGKRKSISVTNNEVAIEEIKKLTKKGLRPGDKEWEQLGICEYITKPRIESSLNGKTPDGKKIDGEYKFFDKFPISDGFNENFEFFTLTYETAISVNHNLSFKNIAPLLWMRAGSEGKRIDEIDKKGWAIADNYALISDLDKSSIFYEEVSKNKNIKLIFIFTDDEKRFQSMFKKLPKEIEIVRLYESYISNFRFLLGN